jgi:hypothetical protein
MNPVRKGDGTALSFPGYSEIRKGDGTVLWQENAIPDSGLVHRYKAGELALSDGDTVSTFTDIKGDADLSANGAPTYVSSSSNLNGKPAVYYDGVDDEHLSADGAVGSSATYHIFYVYDSQATGQQAIMRNEANGQQHRIDSGGSSDEWFHGSFFGDGNSYSNQKNLIGFLYNSNGATVRRNGQEIASDGTTDSSRDDDQWRLGSRNSDYFEGEIAEVIWYNEEKTGPELDKVENYLANEYGFTI